MFAKMCKTVREKENMDEYRIELPYSCELVGSRNCQGCVLSSFIPADHMQDYNLTIE
jgi:hypothetical protein